MTCERDCLLTRIAAAKIELRCQHHGILMETTAKTYM